MTTLYEKVLKLELLLNDMKAEVSQLKAVTKGNKSYAKGYRLEYQIVQSLKLAGFFAIRSPASKGLYDVIAIYNGNIYGIQAKYVRSGEPRLSNSAIKQMLELYDKHKIEPILAYRKAYKPIIFYFIARKLYCSLEKAIEIMKAGFT